VRLARAYRLLAAGVPPAPVHVADQLDAAGEEAQGIADRLGALLPVLVPDRAWFQRTDASPSVGARALLLAALLGCLGTVCCHLRRGGRRGGPQPALVNLALCRVDCARCAQTLRRPPAENADQCDVCDRRGVVTFSPFVVRFGPALIAGDACPTCAGILGIVREATA
jgi:hypothetical protein